MFTLPGFCQVSFPDSNAIWNVNKVGSTGIPARDEMLYGLTGDTIINNTLYHKMYLLADTTLETINLKEYLGGFRQENQKVWFIPRYENMPEFLLYDFTMQIGDTIWYSASLVIGDNGDHIFHFGNNFNVVQDIVNENEVKRIILCCGYTWQDECLTGIGSIYGPFGSIVQIPLSGNGYHIACFKQNDTVKYKDNLICNKCFCSELTGIDEKKNNADWITIFPNPAMNSLSIKIDKLYSNINVVILDEKGSTIYKEESLENPISMTNTLRGVYFIKLTIDNEMIMKKVIIE